MLLTLIVSPRTAGLGMALAMLAGYVLSVAILEWAVMPLLNRALAPWLQAHGRDGRLVSVVGAAFNVAALLGMALLFRSWAADRAWPAFQGLERASDAPLSWQRDWHCRWSDTQHRL